MTAKQTQAAHLFGNGCNCAQAVLAAFCEEYNLTRTTALKLSCGLGGGARCGELCGAVSGAIAVVGLKHGQDAPENMDAKWSCYAKTDEFIAAFKAKHGTVVCRELIGCDLATKEGYEQALGGNVFKELCTELVVSAVEILEALGY